MWQNLSNFKVIFLGILIDALPFILVSVLVSSILHNFISEKIIQESLPTKKSYNILLACCLGVIFPACDCGMVPIVRRLVQKGVPLYSAIAFLLSAPIINPVVAFSTFYAFNSLEIAFFRLFIAFFVASGTSLFIDRLFKQVPLSSINPAVSHGCECHSHSHDHNYEKAWKEKLLSVADDACSEFFEMGKFLILGSAIGAAVQTFLPREFLLAIGHSPLLSVMVMILFAFTISVCSSADAFIASSFISSFSTQSLLAFMVFGPMIDIKNLFMLLHTFPLRFVITLITIVVLLCLLGSYIYPIATFEF